MISPEEVARNLNLVGQRIEEACRVSGRDVSEVTLIAVSKTWPADHLRAAYDVGQRVFGENKLQEIDEKAPLSPSDVDWHFIGHPQRNKVRKILRHNATIHAVDSFKLAEAIHRIASENAMTAEIFLQVNLGDEASKFGYLTDDLVSDFAEIMELANLNVRGLMAIPPKVDHADQARAHFARLRQIQEGLNMQFGVQLSDLSMGMSGDFELAILEGATHVRVGSSIFGDRE